MAKRASIWHLTSAHPWNDVRIFLKEARSAAAAGFDVTLLAQRDGTEVVDGVRCRGIPVASGRAERMLFGPLRILWNTPPADIYHFHDPELIPLGFWWKLLGRRVVYDVHEDLPRQILNKEWLPAWSRRTLSCIFEALELLASRVFDRMVCATPAIAERFPPAKTVLVQNFPLENELLSDRPTSGAESLKRLAYVGVLTKERGAFEMVRAIARVQDTHPGTRLTIAGSLSPDSLLADLKAEPGSSYVDFVGQRDRAEVAQLLRCSAAGLVLFHPIANHLRAQPNKLFEYMSAGLPVLASDFPLWRQLVSDSGAGLLVDPLDVGAIVDTMRYLLNNENSAERMGQMGRQAILQAYSWGPEANKLVAMYQSLLKPPKQA